MFYLCVECVIDTVSYGNSDLTGLSGYIAINGNRVVNTPSNYGTYKSFNLVELNVSSCSASDIRHYDTSINIGACVTTADYSDNMATYINSLPLNTVLIGVTAGDAQECLTQNAKSALLAIGVNVTGLQPGGKVSFVAQIGQPKMTMSQVVDPSNVYNLKAAVNVAGKSYSML